MSIAYFLLFSVYAPVNAYLPVLLKSIGFGTADVGILLGIFESAGVILPLFLSAAVDKNGRYGITMLVLGLVMAFSLLPLTLFHSFAATAFFLCAFALGIRGLIPISDAFTTKSLGNNTKNYGRIRAVGSAGFVCTALILQFTPIVSADNIRSIVYGIGVLGLLYTASLFFVPNIFNFSCSAENSPVKQNSHGKKNPIKIFPASYWFGLILISLGTIGMTPSQKFFSLYMREYLHLESYAGFWAVSALAEIPIMFLSGKLIEKFGIEKLLIVSLISISVRNIVYAVFPSWGGVLAAQLLHSLNFGLFHPVAVLFCMSKTPKQAASLGMTFYSVVSRGLSYMLGSVLGGFVIEKTGYIPMFFTFSIFPIAGILLYIFSLKKKAGI